MTKKGKKENKKKKKEKLILERVECGGAEK